MCTNSMTKEDNIEKAMHSIDREVNTSESSKSKMNSEHFIFKSSNELYSNKHNPINTGGNCDITLGNKLNYLKDSGNIKEVSCFNKNFIDNNPNLVYINNNQNNSCLNMLCQSLGGALGNNFSLNFPNFNYNQYPINDTNTINNPLQCNGNNNLLYNNQIGLYLNALLYNNVLNLTQTSNLNPLVFNNVNLSSINNNQMTGNNSFINNQQSSFLHSNDNFNNGSLLKVLNYLNMLSRNHNNSNITNIHNNDKNIF